MAQIEKDALTGTETTGHEWDGIKELNTPLPKWWVLTFWACIIWAIGYYVAYPAWPTLSDYTKGMLGYSSRAELDNELKMVAESRSAWLGKFENASVGEIAQDSELVTYAMAGGKFIFNENCAPCHGSGGQGAKGYPVLADDDWLWGGTVDAIEQTIRFGIRSGHDEERFNEMIPFGEDLNSAQLAALADYVMNGVTGEGEAKTLFADNCAACHGEDGTGIVEMGGPNLADGIWLFDGSKEGIIAQMTKPKHGVMPAWQGRLDDVSIKQVAIYVHSLGGGQ